MSALEYYAQATRFVLKSENMDENYVILLIETLTPLRFFLACRVCNKLLQQPMTPDHTACQHTVCSACIGGKMKLRPSCGWCQGYENFKPNQRLTLQLKCYSKLCRYILSSSHYCNQIEFIKDDERPEIPKYKEKLNSMLQEGADYVPDDPTSAATVDRTTDSLAPSISESPNNKRKRDKRNSHVDAMQNSDETFATPAKLNTHTSSMYVYINSFVTVICMHVVIALG